MNTIKLNEESSPQNTNRTALLLRQTYPELCPSKRETTATYRWEPGSKKKWTATPLTVFSFRLIAALHLMYSKCVLTSFSK
jgi:hypothetical protein